MITFLCDSCQAQFDVTDDNSGKQFLCSNCQQPITVPPPTPPQPVAPMLSPMAPESPITFYCGQCQARFDVTADKIGKQFLCNKCQNPVTVPEISQVPLNAPPLSPDTPITFYCGQCQARFDVTADKIGKQFLCNKCHNPVKVPPETQPSPFPQEEVPPETPKPSALKGKGGVRRSGLQRSVKRRKTDQTLIYGGGAILLVVIGIIVFFATKPSSQPIDNSQTDPISKGSPSSDEALKEIQAEKWLQEETAKFTDGATSYKATRESHQNLMAKIDGTRAGRKLEKILNDLQTTHENEAQAAFEKIQKDVTFLWDNLEGTETLEQINTYKTEMKRRWSEFPTEYDDTPHRDKIRAELEAIDKATLSSGNASASFSSKKMDALSDVEYLYNGKDTNQWKPISGKWGSKLDKIIGISDSNSAQVQLGDFVLKEFRLDLEFKIIRGTMALWVRSTQYPTEQAIRWNSLSAESLPQNTWIPLVLTWKDGSCTLKLAQEKFSLLNGILPSTIPAQSPFSLGCLPNSEVHFRNLILSTSGDIQPDPDPDPETMTHPDPDPETMTHPDPDPETMTHPDPETTKQPKPPVEPEKTKFVLPDISKMNGKWKEKDGTYTASYDFSQENQLNDFQMAQGSFSIKERSLTGKGFIWLKQLPWTEFTLNFDMKALNPPFNVGVVFGMRDIKNYLYVNMESEWQALNFIEYESDKPFPLDQSVALSSYFVRATNEIEIKVQNKSAEIRINGNLAFKYLNTVPSGFIGFLASQDIRIEKLKMVGKFE